MKYVNTLVGALIASHHDVLGAIMTTPGIIDEDDREMFEFIREHYRGGDVQTRRTIGTLSMFAFFLRSLGCRLLDILPCEDDGIAVHVEAKDRMFSVHIESSSHCVVRLPNCERIAFDACEFGGVLDTVLGPDLVPEDTKKSLVEVCQAIASAKVENGK
jgi:hypothetical protein